MSATPPPLPLSYFPAGQGWSSLPPPTSRERVWDVLRGFGILGIFSLHVFLFSTDYETFFLTDYDRSTDWPWILVSALGNGKFITILAMTFGAGVAMIAAKRSARGLDVRWNMARRSAVLLALGLTHYTLLFFGDILQFYAIAGLIALTFVTARDRTLMHVAVWCPLASLMVGTGFGLLLPLMAAFAPGELAEAFEGTGAEYAAYATGRYTDQIGYRAETWIYNFSYMIVEIPFIVGLFALGMLVWRRGWLAAPSAHPALVGRALWVCLTVGVVVNVLTAIPTSFEWVVATTYPQRYLGGASLGIAIAILLAMGVERGVFKPALKLLSNVGERALTCYLFQSLLGAIIFYSWGLGWYGQLTNVQLLGVLAVVWTLTVLLAAALAAMKMRGPAEWLWRKLAPTS